MGGGSKTPEKTQQEIEAERRLRESANDLTREENERLKAIKRGQRGRRSLLGGGSELGIAGPRGAGAGGGSRGGGRPRGGRGGRTRAAGSTIMGGGTSNTTQGSTSTRRG